MDPELIEALLFLGLPIALFVGGLVWASRGESGAPEAWRVFGKQRGMRFRRSVDSMALVGVDEGREFKFATRVESNRRAILYVNSIECTYGFRSGMVAMKSRSGWDRLMGAIKQRNAAALEQLYEPFYDKIEIAAYNNMINDIVAEQGEEAIEVFMRHIDERSTQRMPQLGDRSMMRSVSAEQRAALVRLREALGGAWVNVTVHASSSHLSISMVNMNRVMSPEKIEALWHVARPHVRRLIAVSRPKDDAEPAGW